MKEQKLRGEVVIKSRVMPSARVLSETETLLPATLPCLTVRKLRRRCREEKGMTPEYEGF
jgi:hypothetical protein